MEKPFTTGPAWSDISPTTAPPQLLYLDTLRASDFGQLYKRQSFDVLDVQAGHRILDVACGPCNDVRALAGCLGADGCVMGIDSNPAMVTASGSGLGGV
jgi:hypothetical protein